MTYVDGFVLPVPKKKLAAYRKMAQMGAKVWKKHGALEYVEAVGDDMKPKWTKTRFPQIANAKRGETVVFSFIVFKSRAHRDKVNAKVMADPAMQPPGQDGQMPFDMNRMAYGGFKTIAES